MADLGAFFGNPNIQRQGARARALASQRDVNTLPDPLTYAVMQGLLGTRPDEMGFSVLNPDYEKIKKVAEPAFALGLLGQAAPALAPLTKGLPVGASVKLININKGIYKPDLTMEEMLKVRDIPTVERVQQSLGLVGEKQFEKMVDAQFKKYKPSSPEQEAMLVESVTLEILGKAQRSPLPRQAALDTAQKNAALPIEEGGLGLPKDNTPEMREKAMGFIDAYHGTTQGARKEQLRDAEGWSDVWATDNPRVANTYATGRPQFGRPEGQAVLPLSVRLENPMVIDAPYGSSWRQIDTALPNDPEVLPYSTDMLSEIAKKQGYDSLLVKNVFDVGGGRIPRSEKGQDALTGTTYAIFNPAQVRSRFAAFDPMRKNDKDLLAGVLPLGLLADEEQRKRLYELMPSLLGE